MIAFSKPIVELVVAKTLTPQPDGTVTLTQLDDTVLSVQPDSTFESRPAGTAGPYEKAIQTAQGLVYAPLGALGKAYLVPFVGEIPNA